MKYPEKCPICGTKWTVTRLVVNEITHCIPCGKKADDIVGKSNKKEGHRYNTWKPSTADYSGKGVKESWSDYDDLLEIMDLDDWDDIFVDIKTKSDFKL